MKVLRSSSQTGLQEGVSRPNSVTIGNFDGCHRAHQLLLETARTLALSTGSIPAVLTFDPHPREYFQPEIRIGKIFQPSQKLRALAELGIQQVFVQSFNREFSQLSPADFCQKLLRDDLDARAVIIGEDFRFGLKRQGSIEDLRTMLPGSTIKVIPKQSTQDRQPVSSSEIRRLLQSQDIVQANELLGRPYLLEGTVRKGQQLGRKLGFPTANLDVGPQLLPGHGVYAGWVARQADCPIFSMPEKRIPCVLNIGIRPSVQSHAVKTSVEIHLLEGQYGEDELYDESMGLYLRHFIRPESKFPSLDALKTQIQQDCRKAKSLLLES